MERHPHPRRRFGIRPPGPRPGSGPGGLARRAHRPGAAHGRGPCGQRHLGAFEGALRYAANPGSISRAHFARFLVEAGGGPGCAGRVSALSGSRKTGVRGSPLGDPGRGDRLDWRRRRHRRLPLIPVATRFPRRSCAASSCSSASTAARGSRWCAAAILRTTSWTSRGWRGILASMPRGVPISTGLSGGHCLIGAPPGAAGGSEAGMAAPLNPRLLTRSGDPPGKPSAAPSGPGGGDRA